MSLIKEVGFRLFGIPYEGTNNYEIVENHLGVYEMGAIDSNGQLWYMPFPKEEN